eukprot:CAMPEP_0195510354 /NCGR_PEP_ID=MMETSP0794_2-20130614/3022_1 /TAXON_ID=515487 /ORGANISM="Stephanopyxis turris, Strain CCMP 815" /LENGTH=190 /DNA_ID=CAMNT_0040637761 /DNA_START=55 /DNA_END=627 /DNA_ORIENTATION=+
MLPPKVSSILFLTITLFIADTKTNKVAAFRVLQISAFSPSVSRFERSKLPRIGEVALAESNNEDNNEFEGLNPFERRSVPGTSGLVGSSQISIRQMKMKSVMSDLLRDDDPLVIREILEQNEDFLMDQINDLNAVLEPESIYHPDMDKQQRFDRYETVMKERVSAASNGRVRNILKAMLDFVLEHDKRTE